jgi:hypothetical protein
VALLVLSGASCRRAPLDVAAVVRGNPDLVVKSDGSVNPLLLQADATVGLCLEIGDTRDTSAWRGVLSVDGRESSTGLVPPAARLGRTLCFEGTLPQGLKPAGEAEVCGRIVDGYDGSERRMPCRSVALDFARGRVRAELMESRTAILTRAPQTSNSATVEELDALAREADARGLPVLAVNLRLIAVHFLTMEATPAALQAALRRLSELPPWVERPEASGVGAVVALQWADLHLALGPDYEQAWRVLVKAEERFLRLARPERFTVTMKQANILARLGATREACQRLRASIADCEALRCNPELLAQARGELAWLTSLDPDATGAELAEAEAGLEAARDRLTVKTHPLEHALQVVNLAYLQVRRSQDPQPLLREARALLEAAPERAGEVGLLLDWVGLITGLQALSSGNAARAIGLCAPLGARSDPTLSAWALSCWGQAEHAQGHLRQADALFERALERHEFRNLSSIQPVQLAPGRGVEDLLWAVRTAVELGEPERAWALLLHTDDLARNERQRLECRGSARGETRGAWERLDAEAQDLYRQLVATSGPASGARQLTLAPVRQDLKTRLRELWQTWPGCAAAPAIGDDGVRFRAAALPDEILLLERNGQGQVHVARRTPLPHARLRQVLERVASAVAAGRADAPEWAALTAPLAEALLPPADEPLGPVTTYSLHGPLQRVPLAALPLGRGWFGQMTAVAVQPAAAPRLPAREARAQDRPVFVVDPAGDLAGATALLPVYTRLFPQARILHGRAATSEAFRGALEGAAWLHLDAHGVYDAAFPELSALVLADRPVSLMELADLPLPRRFANLSACRSGEGPTTSDSGRYGIAGLLVRRGVPWVVASTTDLDDRVARDFNRAFYDGLSRGVSVPEAHRLALADLAPRHPPAAWAPLLLLEGAAVAAEAGSSTPTGLLPNRGGSEARADERHAAARRSEE